MMSAYLNKPEDNTVPNSNAKNRANVKWQAKAMRRIPLDVRKEYYAEVVSKIPELTGMTIGGFIKAAITEKIQRDGLDLPIDQYNP